MTLHNLGGPYLISRMTEQNKKTGLLDCLWINPDLTILGLHLLAFRLELHHWLSWIWSFSAHPADFVLPCLDNFVAFSSVQFSSVAQSCPTLCDPMNRSTPVLPVHHQLPEFTQTHIHRVSDATQPSHPLSSPSPPAPNRSQHQSLFQWVNSSHEVAKVLEFQLQHHSFQRTPRADLL